MSSLPTMFSIPTIVFEILYLHVCAMAAPSTNETADAPETPEAIPHSSLRCLSKLLTAIIRAGRTNPRTADEIRIARQVAAIAIGAATRHLDALVRDAGPGVTPRLSDRDFRVMSVLERATKLVESLEEEEVLLELGLGAESSVVRASSLQDSAVRTSSLKSSVVDGDVHAPTTGKRPLYLGEPALPLLATKRPPNREARRAEARRAKQEAMVGIGV